MTRDQLIAENEKLTAANAELNTQIAAVTAKAEADHAAYKETIEALKVDIAGAAERSDALNTLITEANEELSDARTIIETQGEDIGKLKAALANPAHIDAAMLPASVTVSVSDAEADRLDKVAEEETDANAPKTIREQYEAMPAGPDRLAFLNEHYTEILRDTDSE